jgi:hypothetical protein
VVRPKAIIMAALLPDLSGHLLTVGFSDGNRYERQQRPVELAGQTVSKPYGPGPTATIRGFIETTTAPQLTFGADWVASVTLSPLPSGTPLVVATVPVLGTATRFDATVDLTTIPEGWYMAGVSGMPAGWDYLGYPMYVRQNALAKAQTAMPVVVASWTHEHTGRWAYAMVPATFSPRMVPLPSRSYPDIPAPTMATLAYTMLVPFKTDDIYRPSVLPSGVWTSANVQNYFFSSYSKVDAPWQCLDGPRGKGNLACPTSLRETARPTGGKVLFTDPWRCGEVMDDGTIHTDAGWVHDEPPPYCNFDTFAQQRPPATRRLVGNWSAVPQARWGFQELWDVAVDYRTVAIDPNSTPIGNPPEQTHVMSVVKYVTDTQKGRVCKLTFGAADLTRTAVVSEFVTGLSFPWGCETVGNLLLVTESGGTPQTTAGRVLAYDMDTGALVWQVPLPRAEGIRVLDGFAYVGSLASKAVWKIDLTTRAVTKHLDLSSVVDGNSRFVNLAVSDGTFGPRGSVAVITWTAAQYGWPAVFSPTGVRLQIGDRANGWGEPKGTYVPGGLSYGSAVSIGKGRMTWGTVQDGLHRVSAALPTDTVVPAAVAAGVQKWYDRDYRLIWSDYGFGLYGVPLPWGKDADIDAMLTNMGHS